MSKRKSVCRPGILRFAMRSCGLLALAIVPFAFALDTARMALPDGFEEQTKFLSATGFGGKNKGSYVIGAYQGEFTRGESRLGLLDSLYVSSKGKSSFTLGVPDGMGPLAANCQMKKGTAAIGVITFDSKKMNYHCEFRQGSQMLGARFILGQPKPDNLKEKFLASDIRRGEAIIFDQHFTIESVHRHRNSRFQSSVPVGYLISSGERIVAAVELTDWNPSVYILRDLPETHERGTMVVVMAIAVLRDPADSALDE